jgi:hypothetical protein
LISSQRVSSYSFPLEPKFWKQLWNLNLNARLKLLLWKIASDILPSKARLQKVFPISPADSLCPLCKMAEDSLPHLFFNCSIARIVWRSSFWPLDSLAWSALTLSSWVKGIISPHFELGIPLVDEHLFQIYASVFCDLLWFTKNKVIHEGIPPDIAKLASSIKKSSLAHTAAWGSSTVKDPQVWIPPQAGHFKINFDTAIRDQFSVQAAVCRDSNGTILKATTQVSPPCTPNYGEAQGALLATSLAVSLILSNFVIEGDFLIVISALQFPAIISDWQIEKLTLDTLALLPPSSK